MQKESIVRIGLRIPYALNTVLIQQSQKMGMTKNGLVLQILWDWVKLQEQV